MTTYTLIEMMDIELTGVDVYLDRGAASERFNALLEEYGLQELDSEEFENELFGTIRMAGDDAHSLQLLERFVGGANAHDFVVSVSGCDREQAEQVMGERCGPDEDYGFEYTIDWKRT